MEEKGGFYSNYLKRVLDIVISVFALIVLSPIMVFTAIIIRITLGTPVIFCQERPGKNEKIFKLYKFRTMSDEKDENGNLLPDEKRMGKIGSFIRKFSLDEIPEFWNILKGDMSFIGPRPLLVQYLPLYNEFQHKRHLVRPGLTGLAQVNGRNLLSFEERFEYDVNYVSNVSLWLDLKILFLTFSTVFSRKGVSSENCATMEYFTGTDNKSEEKEDVLSE